MIASIALHVLALFGVWGSAWLQDEEAPVLFESYAIEIHTPPPREDAAEMEVGSDSKITIETPDPGVPEPPKPEPAEAPRPEPQRQPNRPPEANRVTASVTTSDRPNQPSRGPGADPTSAGGSNVNARIEGLRRDYPAYYARIVEEINICLLRTSMLIPKGSRYETTLEFAIMRSGRVDTDDVRVVKRSGSPSFDDMMIEVVDCASKRGFGQFPAEIQYDRLPIQYEFTPPPDASGFGTSRWR